MSKFALAEVIGDLRKELSDAVTQAAGESIRFQAGEIEVELSVEVEVKAGGGIQFWVVNIGGSAGRTRSHTIKIPLKPVDANGNPILTGGSAFPT